jgi:hypothetical protein
MEVCAGGAGGMTHNVKAARGALESAGIVFVDENGHGPGVRLRKSKKEKG